jgi:hypothetical protein
VTVGELREGEDVGRERWIAAAAEAVEGDAEAVLDQYSEL